MVLADGRIIYIREDGKGLIFEKDGDRYKAPAGYDYELERIMSLDAVTEDSGEDENEDDDPNDNDPDYEAGNSDTAETDRGKASLKAAKGAAVSAEADPEDGEDTNEESTDEENMDENEPDEDEIDPVLDSIGWQISQPDGTIKQFNSNGLLVRT